MVEDKEGIIALYLDFVNMSQVKVRLVVGSWWYKPYPFPQESK